MTAQIDCIIPVHAKDVRRLPACVSGLRRCVPGVGRILVVASDAVAGDIADAMATVPSPGAYRVIGEEAFATMPAASTGPRARAREWLLQQRIKLEGHRLVETDHYLVVDADVVFLNETRLFDEQGRVTVAYDAPRRQFASHPIGQPCHSFASVGHHLLHLDLALHDVCYICHHMVFRTAFVREMLDALGDWHATIERIVPITEVWSEYDIYVAFLKQRHPDTFVLRDAPWLDVPWTGADDAARDGYLDLFRQAGVSFVALHHHFGKGWSLDECQAFARETCARLSDRDSRGRWPLTCWLARRERHRAWSGEAADVGCEQVLGLIQQIFVASLTSMVVRYAHVRCDGTFACAAPWYQPGPLADLRVDVLELDLAVSMTAEIFLIPLVEMATPAPLRGPTLDAITETKAALDRLAPLLSDPARPPDARTLSAAVDAARLAFGRLSRMQIDFAGHARRIEQIAWHAIAADRWIALADYVARHSAEIGVLARWMARVLTPAQWATVRPRLESGPLFIERLGSPGGACHADHTDRPPVPAESGQLCP